MFLYDYSEETKGLKRVKKRNTLVVYQYQNRIKEQNVIESVKHIASLSNCRIVSVFEFCNWADENIVCTPFEAMSYIQKAEYVITDTFHGCVLSIKFNKKFAVLCRESNYNKISDLLRTFQLEKQIISDASDIAVVLNREIDWKNVNALISEQKESAVCYLSDSLPE